MLAMMDIRTGATEREAQIYRCGSSSTVARGREEERDGCFVKSEGEKMASDRPILSARVWIGVCVMSDEGSG